MRPPTKPKADSTRPGPLRIALGFLAFYAATVASILGAVVVHEVSHLVAHEGLTVPQVTYHDGVADAEASLLAAYPYTIDGRAVTVRQPEQSTISLYPNVFVNALGLGILPRGSYEDGGVLASTFFHLDGHEVPDVVARGGTMAPAVQVAPLVVAVAIFLAAVAWVVVAPNLANRALVWAYAVQIGDNAHHALQVGIPTGLFQLATALAMATAVVLVCVRSKTFRAYTARPAVEAPAPAAPASPAYKPNDARLHVRRVLAPKDAPHVVYKPTGHAVPVVRGLTVRRMPGVARVQGHGMVSFKAR